MIASAKLDITCSCHGFVQSYNLETEEGHEDISGWGEASSRLAGNASGSTPKSAGLGNHAANAAAPRRDSPLSEQFEASSDSFISLTFHLAPSPPPRSNSTYTMRFAE